MSATNLSKGERDFELKRLSHDSGEYSDEDDGEDVLEEDALRHGPRRVSDSSIESFELYTPDEERAVVRKLDVNVVLFMSFLYLLSFLDRTSMHLPLASFGVVQRLTGRQILGMRRLLAWSAISSSERASSIGCSRPFISATSCSNG